MAFQCTLSDVEWWASPLAQETIDTAETLSWAPTEVFDSTGKLRKKYPQLSLAQLNACIELVTARHLAAAKLGPESARWFLTVETVQQATARSVVDHRAQRLAAACQRGIITGVHDATCSIGTELAALQRVSISPSGSDLDAVRLAMANHNVSGVPLTQTDALQPDWSETVATLIDPARRTATGQRMYHGPESTTPSLIDVLRVYHGRPYVVKAAPGIDWRALQDDGWGTAPWTGEIEIVSIAGSKKGGVKEAALWSPEFVSDDIHRRATVVQPTGEVIDTITDAPENRELAQAQIPQAPGHIIVEPNGAIIRAGLVREWGVRHGLWLIDERIAHLSGDTAPVGIPYYEVTEEVRFQQGDLKKALRRLPTSSLEILVRGVEADPTQLRKRILPKPVPDAPARTLIISRIGQRAVAFICSARQVR